MPGRKISVVSYGTISFLPGIRLSRIARKKNGSITMIISVAATSVPRLFFVKK